MMDFRPRESGIEVNQAESSVSAAAPEAIEVNIGELVLHGFAPQGRFSIGDMIRCELTELLNEGGFPPAWLEGAGMDHLDGGTFDVTPGFRPEIIGRLVARVVYERCLTAAER
jgi:hypothetical protein